jgi:cell division protein FtsN
MSAEKGGHYDMTLEGRHLLGIFFVVVLLCAVFFTLGFVLGRNQAVALHTAAPPAAPPSSGTKTAEPQPRDLTFHDRVQGAKPSESIPATQPTGPPATAPPPTPSARSSAQPIYLQVAAMSQEADARRMAAELQKLGFDSEVRPPKEDRLYRVLVGPLENDELAAAARRRLEAHGFKDVVRR